MCGLEKVRSTRKEVSMNFSIDLCIDNGTTKRLIPETKLLEIARGCRDGLDRLGKLQEAVKTIRVTFENYDGEMKPDLRIFYQDPLGQEAEYRIRVYSYPGAAEKPMEKMIADRIAEQTSDSLQYRIRVHLDRCREKIWAVERKIQKQLSTPADAQASL